MKSIVVVGGGITGLSCAYFASKQGYKVTVIEAEDKTGGLLDTFEIGGTRLEKFYHHYFTHDTELRWLLNDLGIEDKLNFYESTMGVFSGGKIYNFNGPLDLLKMDVLGITDKLRFGASSLYLSKFSDWKKSDNIPVYDWLNKFAGRKTTLTIWEPLLKSKFGPYYREVPLSWMIGRLSQRMRSRTGTKEKLGYIKGSSKTLIDRLEGKLKDNGVDLITGTKVQSLKVAENKIMSVETSMGTYPADDFIFTTPATVTAALLKPQHQQYAEELERIKYFSAMCLVLELKKPLGNIYWTNISEENFSFGGIIEHTNLIPASQYSGNHIVYLSRYFSPQEEIAGMDRKQLEQLMLGDLKKVHQQFNLEDIKDMYFFKSNTAATVCDLNFSKKVPTCKTPLENLYLVNMAHIYPDERSCNNSVRTAAKACRVMGIDTSYVPQGSSLSGLIGMQ